jgi:ABC-type transport system substrate-binding protein
LDAWLEEGKQAMNGVERRRIYAEIQQHIIDEAMILPIRDYVNLNAASADVRGLRYDRQGWFPWLYEVDVEER